MVNQIILPQVFELALQDKKSIAEQTSEVSFDITGKNFKFKPGQYLRLTLPQLSDSVERGSSRDFTIIFSANEPQLVKIAYRDSDSQFKQKLAKLPIGSRVQVQAPLGVFTLPENVSTPLIFIAGGMGITPFLSMIRYIVKNKLVFDIQLVYINSDFKRAAYLQELRQLVASHSNIKLIEKIHRVDTDFLKQHLTITPKHLWYICGLPAMVEALAQQIPTELNVFEANLRIEEYVGYEITDSNYKILAPVSTTIKEIKASEAQVNQRLIKPLLEAVGQTALVAITDVQGSILYINQKFIEVSKYLKEELIGQNHRILKSGFHPPEFYRHLWQTISGGKIWRGEIKNRAKDGSFYWVDTSISPLVDAQGQIERYVAVRFLITDKKKLAEARDSLEQQKNKAIESRDRLDIILKSIGDGVFVIDRDSKIILFNQQASDISGFSEAEVMGKQFDQVLRFLFKETGQSNTEFIKQSMITGKVQIMAKGTVLIRKDGQRVPVADSAAPLRGRNGQVIGVVVIFRDISREEEVDRLKTEFLSVASHQLRTPLGSMRWNLELLLGEGLGKLTGEAKERVAQAYESNKRLIGLVNDLLDVSRIEQLRVRDNPETVEIDILIQGVIRELQEMARSKEVNLKFQVKGEKPLAIVIDKNRLVEVIENLVANAIKYNKIKGQVLVQLTKIDNLVEISVADTGIGIPLEDQDKIFGKFYRARNAAVSETEGSGLGLSVVKSYIEGWGGSISFVSKLNKGSTFTIRLPMQPKSNRLSSNL